MCKFFTFFSDGKGKLLIVTPEMFAKVLVAGLKDKNGNGYEPHSHSSYASMLGINQDDYNAYEYDPEKDCLTLDSLRYKDDSKLVHEKIKTWFKGKDVTAMRNLYGHNSGDRNSGDGNSGNGNSGYRNSGDRNSGDGNSGDGNSGYGNSGYRNSGDRNSGYRNSGDGNSGDRNSGNGNSGYRNSGDGNSGNGNSGYRNASTTMSFYCASDHYFMFDKKATKEETEKAMFFIDLPLCAWINESGMTDQEKIDNPYFYVAQGYLKTREYKEAWSLVGKKDIERIKKLPHFDAKVFKKITGLDV